MACKKAPVHIEYQGVYVKPTEMQDGLWKLEIETTVENSFGKNRELWLETALYESGKKIFDFPQEHVAVEGFNHVICKQETVLNNVRKWNLELPCLYEIGVRCISLPEKDEVLSEELESDYLKVRFGFRTIQLDSETGFWLMVII